MARSERQFAKRFRVPDRRARARAGNDLRRADQERLRTLSAGWKVARLSQPDRRKRMGGADQRSAPKGLLRERAARRDVGRCARSVRHLLWNNRRPSLRIVRRRRFVESDRARFASCPVSRSANAEMIRVVLPHHLRTLAKVGDEVHVDLNGSATVKSILEAKYPMLRGTIREHNTLKRRPLVRFFVCGEDISHESPDGPLPDAIVKGAEPFFIMGAIAGG